MTRRPRGIYAAGALFFAAAVVPGIVRAPCRGYPAFLARPAILGISPL